MSLFRPRNSSLEFELEKALQGISLSGTVTITYDSCGKKKNEMRRSPVYVLPTEGHDGIVHGIFRYPNGPEEAAIGFVRKSLIRSQYYTFDEKGTLGRSNPNEKIFLPLILIPDMYQYIVEEPNQSNPTTYPILGIESNGRRFPLVLLTSTDTGLTAHGIVDTNSNISTYVVTQPGLEKSLRKFLRSYHNLNPSPIILPPATKNKPESQARSSESRINLSPSSKTRNSSSNSAQTAINWEHPPSIVRYLDEYVIGQHQAKKSLAVTFSNYMTRYRTRDENLPKDNALLIGPTGVGKTYMVHLLATKAALLMIQTKLTGKSTEGYKGENLSEIFEQLRVKTDEQAPYAVIFLDEIDKLARDEWGSGSGFGPRLQDELIGWFEESTNVSDSSKNKGNLINTKNLLFVTAGAFQGFGGNSLSAIITKRIGGTRTIGFAHNQINEEDTCLLDRTKPDDLINYGLKPELIGRLPAIGVLHPLDLEQKASILTNSKGSPLHRYTNLLKIRGYQLRVEEGVAHIIATHCPTETGARALHSLCHTLLTDIIYEPKKYANSQKIISLNTDLAESILSIHQ